MLSPSVARWMPRVSLVLPLVLAAACTDAEAPPETAAGLVGGSGGAGQTGGTSAAAGNGGRSSAGSGGIGSGGDAGSSAGQAGTATGLSGQGGSSPVTTAPQTRAYTLVPTKTVPLGSYAAQAHTPPLHLRLTNENGAISAQISADYGTAATTAVALDASLALADAPTSPTSKFQPEGPLSFNAGVQADIHSVARVALDLDADGFSHRAIVRGRYSPPGLLCTQNVSGDDFVGTYDLVADTASPLVANATNRLPWETELAVNKPALLASTDTTLSPGGMTLAPKVEGGLLARAGKTLTFVFPGLTDADGHASSPEASITFRDLGPGVPAESFGDQDACTSTESAAGFARLVKKPGATSVNVRLCDLQGFGQAVVRVQGETGEPVRQTVQLAKGGVTANVPLPAGPAVLVIESAACFTKIAGFALELGRRHEPRLVGGACGGGRTGADRSPR